MLWLVPRLILQKARLSSQGAVATTVEGMTFAISYGTFFRVCECYAQYGTKIQVSLFPYLAYQCPG
jgi:hypothetical protein